MLLFASCSAMFLLCFGIMSFCSVLFMLMTMCCVSLYHVMCCTYSTNLWFFNGGEHNLLLIHFIYCFTACIPMMSGGKPPKVKVNIWFDRSWNCQSFRSVSQRPAAQTVWYAMPHGRKSSPAVSFQLWIPPETGPGWWFQSCFMFHFIFHICDVIPTPLTKSIIFQMVKLHHQPGYSPSLTNNNHNH
jgi:hypothetical protein